MEFKKINENTFECLLSKEDMEDYDITMEDFLKDQEKTMDFMHKIIEMSEEEIDFEPTGGVMSMQISPLPGEGLSLVFSNRQPMSGLDILSHMRDFLKAHVDGLEDLDDTDAIDVDDDEDDDDSEFQIPSFRDLNSVFESLHNEEQRKKKSKTVVNSRLYYFDSFSVLEAFCKAWSGGHVKSQMLKSKSDGGYYLVVDKGRLSKADYSLLLEMLGEYAKFITDSDLKILSLREYADTVIAKDAVSVLKKL